MSNKTVVLAIFSNEAAADTAAESLKDSGVAKKDAIGVLVLDEKGKIKIDKVGKRSMGKGAGIGVALALVTPVGLGAVLVGGGLGALHHKNVGLGKVDRDRIGSELEGGKAAAGVLAPVSESSIVASKLTIWAGPQRLMMSQMRSSMRPTRLPRRPRLNGSQGRGSCTGQLRPVPASGKHATAANGH